MGGAAGSHLLRSITRASKIIRNWTAVLLYLAGACHVFVFAPRGPLPYGLRWAISSHLDGSREWILSCFTTIPAPALSLCPADMYLSCYKLTQNRDTEEQREDAGAKGELGSVPAT